MYKVLDERENEQIAVAIRWDDLTNQCNLLVIDKVDDVIRQVDVPNDQAIDAFNHPYIYLERG